MLIGNYSVLAKDPGRSIGGGAIGLGNNRGDFNKSSTARGRFAGEAWEPKSGVPDGYRNPYTWVIPQTDGGLSARNNLSGAGSATISMAGGVNGEAALSGAGDLTGTGALIVSLVAALTGSGTISNAAAIAYLNLAASLAGAGDLAGAATAIGHASAALSGAGDITGTATALGTLAASIIVTGDVLNTANVAGAVWNALVASHGEDGTMGKALANASSGGVDYDLLAAAVWAYATKELSASGNADVADKLLARALQGGADGGRTVQDALRAIRNKTAIAGSTLTVYEEDDATPAWTATIATASRDPLTGIDPA